MLKYILLVSILIFSACSNKEIKISENTKIYKNKYYKQLLEKCSLNSNELDCSNRNITDNDLLMINFSQFTEIEKIDLSNNNLNKIPDSISYMYNLKELDLSNNNINYPDIICSTMFNLKTLDLSNNGVKVFNTDIFLNSNLEEINLKNNDLKYINSLIMKIKNIKLDKDVKIGG